ncbi:GAF domain-containing protein [Cerasicoccus fimbriatus]|uniref:GAF domain-containing protein n=1 Tax=Cerasicoccus fimbriatus TaxID=3014554 RepID=UPI0022B45ACD|nr:GAF domain-containing protein [Cerasicoccus sp. TK19100]
METAAPERSVIDSLYRISRLVSETDDAREALEAILQELVDVLGASSASVALTNPDTNLLEIEVTRGLQLKNKFSLPLGIGITGWVALHGKPLLVPDVHREPRYIAVKDSVRSEMAAPMLIDGSPVGVVNVDSDRENAFSEQDLKLLSLLTIEATSVVSRLWLIRQLKEKNHQLQTLLRIGQLLGGKRELRDVLKSLTRESRKLMHCSICAIYLLTEDRKRLKLEVVSGTEGPIDYQEELPVNETAVGVAIDRRKQVAIQNLPQTEEHHFIEITQSAGLASLLATPIIVDGRAIGVLNAYTDTPHRFNNDERQLFTSMASMGAVAIQNSKLYARVFQSEESLRKNERLTTLGLLSAEIAHEIRNPLTVIKLLFESLTLDFDDADPRHQDTVVISEKILQLEEIVGRVLSFGKSRTGMHSLYDLNKLVEETILLVRLKAEQTGVELVCKTHKGPLSVEAHKGQIQQVLLNLVLNAFQAMPNGGKVEVSIECSGSEEMPVGQVSVRDNGPGIPANLRDRIFQSFLSGREEGSGLGLAISKQIIKSHRGDIYLVETGPQGTTFQFSIPLAD